MIELDRFSYSYPAQEQPALSDVSVRIAAGEFVLVVGASGAGKSTFLRCLNGLVPHFTGGRILGRVRVDGQDPVAAGPRVMSRLVGFVFQDPEAQFVVDRVEAEIAFALENLALPRAEMRRLVENALDLLDLRALRDRPLSTLSGGQKQRVAIAAALALQPRILVLDEPTSQLDAESAEDVLQALVRLNRDRGLTIILAEHRLERILGHASQVVYLSAAGEALRSGPPREVLRSINLAPPVVALGKALGWEPLPLTVEEAGKFVPPPSPSPFRRGKKEAPSPSPSLAGRGEGSTGEKGILVVEQLGFSYGSTPVLGELSFELEGGALVALLGRNGSGKTTLLRSIVGLLRPQTGSITLDGRSIIGKETAEICKSIAYLPQLSDDLLYADTVLDELKITVKNHGRAAMSEGELLDFLGRLGLAGFADRYPRDLSAGQRQRIALGAVTIVRPRLLLLDEPTRGLDYGAKHDLASLLAEWKASGLGILLVTHDIEFAALVADRALLLAGGKLAADRQSDDAPKTGHLFSSQIARLFPETGWLTLADALNGDRESSLVRFK